jgi:hypothetical protein
VKSQCSMKEEIVIPPYLDYEASKEQDVVPQDPMKEKSTIPQINQNSPQSKGKSLRSINRAFRSRQDRIGGATLNLSKTKEAWNYTSKKEKISLNTSLVVTRSQTRNNKQAF